MFNSTIPAPGGAGQQKSLFEQQPDAVATPPAKTPQRGESRFMDRAPIAAKSDPVSSHLAAAEVTASGLRAGQKAEILWWLRSSREPLTSAEVAADGSFDRHAVARRLPDLAAYGLIERCPIRLCRKSGRPSVTWRAV